MRCHLIAAPWLAFLSKHRGNDIHVHDRVLLTRRNRKLGVENGFMGEVVRIDQETATFLVRLDQDGGLGRPQGR